MLTKFSIQNLHWQGLVCFSPDRWLFWIDKGGGQYTAYIGRGAMDGDSRSFFVSSNLFSPTGLTVDYQGIHHFFHFNLWTSTFDLMSVVITNSRWQKCEI